MNLTEIEVKVIDIAKLNKDINEMAVDYMKSIDKFDTNAKFGIRSVGLGIVIKPDGTKLVIDDELVGDILEGNKYNLAIYTDIEVDDRTKKIGMFPSLNTAIDLDELIKTYTLENTVDVVQFMGRRYNYNGRIKSNQNEFKKWFNENKIQ